MRVVQIDPGPMQALDRGDGFDHARRMPVRGVDDDHVDAGLEQRLGPAQPFLADPGGGGHAEAALRVLAGVGVGLRLFHVLYGDQADTAIGLVDHQ
jgi:hypothetical protein